SPLKRQAFDALHDFGREAVVFLLDGRVGLNARTAPNGSGTLFRTPGGQIVVLSAAHVFDDVPEDGMSIGGKTRDGVSNAIAAVHKHPSSDVDIAVGVLSDVAARVFGAFALSPDFVAGASDTAFERENPMLICGYPTAYKETTVDRARGSARIEFACVSYLTWVERKLDSRARYRATWKEAVLTEHDPVVPAVKPGEVFEIAHPGGISGGPLWRFRTVGKGEIWAPAKMGKIVGVASSYLDDVEFCPSIAAWGDWFREVIAAIDAALPAPPGSPREHFHELGEPRHDGQLLSQMVLIGPWNIHYSLNEKTDEIGITIGGAGDARMPEWLFPSARRYAQQNRSLLLSMLRAARHGDFHASGGGVVQGTFRSDEGEFVATYTRWDDDQPIIGGSRGVTHEIAREIARMRFGEIPGEIRKRLFAVARNVPTASQGEN
ncbi:MAG: hypothetical protein ABW061_05465, partial [Polyangiaceae bacterium]